MLFGIACIPVGRIAIQPAVRRNVEHRPIVTADMIRANRAARLPLCGNSKTAAKRNKDKRHGAAVPVTVQHHKFRNVFNVEIITHIGIRYMITNPIVNTAGKQKRIFFIARDFLRHSTDIRCKADMRILFTKIRRHIRLLTAYLIRVKHRVFCMINIGKTDAVHGFGDMSSFNHCRPDGTVRNLHRMR